MTGTAAGKKRQSEGACTRPAGWGTNHGGIARCKLHRCSTANNGKAAKVAKASDAVQTYGLPVDVNPHVALLEEAHRTAGRVRWLGTIVAALDRGALVWGITEEADNIATGFPGTDVERAAAPNIWLELYHRERAHLVKVAGRRSGMTAQDPVGTLGEQQGAVDRLLAAGLA